MNILLITEANEKVASGHLYECIVIAHELIRNGDSVLFLINHEMQDKLKKNIDIPYQEYSTPIDEWYRSIADLAIETKTEVIVTNLREINEVFIIQLKQALQERRKLIDNSKDAAHIPIICIDELGHRKLSCDAIVNPMVDPYYWLYPETKGPVFSGQKYLVLPDSLTDYHHRTKGIRNDISEVTVSMGGVDLHGHSLLLGKWLPEILPDSKINIVCGGGFTRMEELQEIVDGNEHVSVYQNIDFLYDLFYHSDLAFSAGGNTLHELAAIGTPTITIPTMPHELNNGRRFSELGFGITIVNYDSFSIEDIQKAVKKLQSRNMRAEMSCCGKAACDGEGRRRIIDIINEVCGRNGKYSTV